MLDFGDYNADPTGTSPQIWEIGLYAGTYLSSSTFMVAYGTFTEEIKTSAIQLENLVRIIF